MMYEFQIVGGQEVIELPYSMPTAPRIGEVVQYEGKSYMRILSRSVRLNSEQIATVTHGYPYESRSLPDLPESVCKKSPDGFPIIRSQQHEREVMAMTGRIRD